jgi:hypothetical protein
MDDAQALSKIHAVARLVGIEERGICGVSLEARQNLATVASVYFDAVGYV